MLGLTSLAAISGCTFLLMGPGPLGSKDARDSRGGHESKTDRDGGCSPVVLRAWMAVQSLK